MVRVKRCQTRSDIGEFSAIWLLKLADDILFSEPTPAGAHFDEEKTIMVNRMAGDVFADLEVFQRSLEQLLGSASRASGSIRSVPHDAFPALNIGTTAEATEIFAFAPGVTPESIDVSIDKGVLTIAGARERDEASSQLAEPTRHASERRTGAFRRSISLPEDADAEKVEARYRDGVLRVKVPKREASRPRRIEIS